MSTPEIPHSREVERALLGCVLASPSCLDLIPELAPDDFYLESHRLTFRRILDLTSEGTPLDIVVLVEALTDRGELQRAGGAAYVAGLIDGVSPEPAIIGNYVKILKRKTYQRELITVAQNALSKAYSGAGEPGDIAAGLISDVSSLNGNKVSAESREAAGKASGECPQIPPAAYHWAVARYCDLVGPTTEAPDNFHVACFLTLLGAALGPSVYTLQSEPLYPIFFAVLVGTAGEPRKGTAIAKAARLMLEAGGRDVLEVLRSLDSAEGFTRRVAKVQGPEGLIQGRPAGVPFKPVLFRISEYRSLLAKANRENAGNLTPKLCEAYDRDALEVNTSVNPAYVPEPYISLLAGTSIAYLRELKHLDIEGGLGSRTMFVPGVPKQRIPRPPAPAEPAYSDFCAQIGEVVRYWRGKAAAGSISIDLEADAFELWRPYYIGLPRRAGDDALMTALIARFHHHTLKTALLYAALDRSEVITVAHLTAAIAYGDFLLDSLWYVFSEFGLPPWVELERRILARVREAGSRGIQRRRLQKLFWRNGSEEFQRRMKALTAPNSELVEFDVGKQRWVRLAD